MSDLLQTGLSNAVAAAVLALAVAVPAFLMRHRRPAVVHALWLLVLVKLVTPPLWKLPVPWAVGRGEVEAEAEVVSGDGEVKVAYVTEEQWKLLTPAPPPPAPAPPPVDWVKVATLSAAAAWLAGSAACLGLIVVRTRQFRRLLREAVSVPPEVRRRAEVVADRFGLGGCPDVVFVPGAVCPMLWAAFGAPRLLLPRGLWERLDKEQRDTLIAHELAHLRRRDHWVRWVEVAATVLYWWHPVLWWARRQLRDAEEQCCDAWVVWSMPAGVRHYMSAILEAVEFVSGSGAGAGPGGDCEPNRGGRPAPPAVPMLATGMGEFRRLERRLWMIRSNQSPRRLGRLGLAAVLLAGAAVLPLAPSLAQDEPKDADEPNDLRGVVVDLVPATDATADPAAPSTDAPDAASAAVAFTPEGSLVVTADEAPAAGETSVFDARTGQLVLTARDGSLRIVSADGSELDQARAEVEALSASLAAAKERLRDLEKRGKEEKGPKAEGKFNLRLSNTVREPAKASGAHRLTVKKVEPVTSSFAPAGKGGGKGAGDADRRLERLEQKLEQLDELLREMRELKEKPGDEPGKDKGPRKY